MAASPTPPPTGSPPLDSIFPAELWWQILEQVEADADPLDLYGILFHTLHSLRLASRAINEVVERFLRQRLHVAIIIRGQAPVKEEEDAEEADTTRLDEGGSLSKQEQDDDGSWWGHSSESEGEEEWCTSNIEIFGVGSDDRRRAIRSRPPLLLPEILAVHILTSGNDLVDGDNPFRTVLAATPNITTLSIYNRWGGDEPLPSFHPLPPTLTRLCLDRADLTTLAQEVLPHLPLLTHLDLLRPDFAPDFWTPRPPTTAVMPFALRSFVWTLGDCDRGGDPLAALVDFLSSIRGTSGASLRAMDINISNAARHLIVDRLIVDGLVHFIGLRHLILHLPTMPRSFWDLLAGSGAALVSLKVLCDTRVHDLDLRASPAFPLPPSIARLVFSNVSFLEADLELLLAAVSRRPSLCYLHVGLRVLHHQKWDDEADQLRAVAASQGVELHVDHCGGGPAPRRMQRPS